jgi:hypothetical protein
VRVITIAGRQTVRDTTGLCNRLERPNAPLSEGCCCDLKFAACVAGPAGGVEAHPGGCRARQRPYKCEQGVLRGAARLAVGVTHCKNRASWLARTLKQ